MLLPERRLQRGVYAGQDQVRGVCRFTMRRGDEEFHFAVSYEAIDDLAETRGNGADARDKWFEELRERIETMAERRFFDFTDQEDRPAEILIREQRLFP